MPNDLPFSEWYKENSLKKAPARGGIQTPISPPSYGGTLAPKVDSKYDHENRLQPESWIEDVDMESNFFSPFQPIAPFGPPNVNRPREWDFPTGYNLRYIQPRMELMAMLRGMRASWGVLATIIETRKDQLLRIPWTIQLRDKPRKNAPAVEQMRKFFKRPDGKLSYSQWTRKLTDDLLVLDAPTVYFTRDRRGRPLTAEVLDGATIFPLIDDAGRRPDTIVQLSDDGIDYLRRQPAFQQIIKGLPMVDLDESELMQVPMRPRPHLPMYGYPPTEQILTEASEAIRKTFYQLEFWAEGTIPDLIVTVPKEWSPRQIAMFQAHFDALLSGNLRLKSKVRFLPGDMKPFDVKNANGESLWSQRDETLIRLACYAYSVSPAPFVKMLNRSTAQNAQQMAEEEGLYPFMSYWKDDIMDPIIQERFGFDDVEFVFLPRPEPDQERQAKIHDTQVKAGYRTRNEVREDLGLEPFKDGDVPMIEIGNAVIPLSAAVAGHGLPIIGVNKPDLRREGAQTSGDKTPAENMPQHGPVKPTHATSAPSVGKGVTYSDVADAARDSDRAIESATHVQRKVGNYKKGHIWIQGLNISIENEKGSLRTEKNEKGEEHSVKMPAPYGYIRGVIGADNMQMDVYLGKHPDSRRVWIVDQDKISKKGKDRGFDEHKVFLGYNKLKKVMHDYLLSHYDGRGHERVDKVVELSIKELKNWLKTGNHKVPVSDQDVGNIVLKNKDVKPLRKSDTISGSTNLSWYDQTTAIPRRGKRKRKLKSGPRWLTLQAQMN